MENPSRYDVSNTGNCVLFPKEEHAVVNCVSWWRLPNDRQRRRLRTGVGDRAVEVRSGREGRRVEHDRMRAGRANVVD